MILIKHAFHVQYFIDNITSHYCIKTDSVGDTPWPDGRYCVYRKGDKCPGNMVSSKIFWDDEDTNNRNKGI